MSSNSTPRSLYSQLLGPSFERLATPFRVMHDDRPLKKYAGLGEVTSGDGWIARFVAWVARLPRAEGKVSVTVTIERTNTGERWVRHFGGHKMQSTLGFRDGLLVEQLGPVTLEFELVASSERIDWVVKRVRAFFLPLPVAWFAGCTASETIKDGRYHFEACADIAGIGLVVLYRGWLVEDAL